MNIKHIENYYQERDDYLKITYGHFYISDIYNYIKEEMKVYDDR